ncbi:hypothetical protein Bca101_010490 [Brassica carinata]
MDDVMFFLELSTKACSTIKEILHLYERSSDHKIDPNKSLITYSSKTPLSVKKQDKTKLGFKEGGVGKHIGLPEHFRKTHHSHRTRQLAATWSNRFLSTAGKRTILKFVFSAILTYAISCFRSRRAYAKEFNLCSRYSGETLAPKRRKYVGWLSGR